jgi:hypothetical protein
MGRSGATVRLIRFFEVLSLIEIILVRILMFALFFYGACQLVDKFYTLEKSRPATFNVPEIRPQVANPEGNPEDHD